MNPLMRPKQPPWYLAFVMPLLLVALGFQPSIAQTSQQSAGLSTVAPAPTVARNGVARAYFIAADEVDWDYTPSGRNRAGLPHLESGEDESGLGLKHRVYHKAIYREYTDATFKNLKPRPPEWAHLGILGPLIRVEVGDSVRVVFRNNTHLALTIHPHGVQYGKDAEGTLYQDGTQGGGCR